MARTAFTIAGLILATSFATLTHAAGTEDVFELQPEIHHIFREDAKMPPATFSMLFTVIILAPWVVLLGGWLQLGYTPAKVISGLTSGGSRTLYISSFLASLVGFEYLFYLYWARLNLFQTLGYMTGLTVITFITGQRALSSIQQTRILNEKK